MTVFLWIVACVACAVASLRYRARYGDPPNAPDLPVSHVTILPPVQIACGCGSCQDDLVDEAHRWLDENEGEALPPGAA